MDRPALKQLLDDIDSKRIQVVVVYKVDRLTRSLADFAKIVERFDGRGVSFVSVTQQFNTTSSMGRLTLNVLLSFAQFEREVTGERIRDKIAASKQKGMWMGGVPPLGYKGQERTLAIDDPNAELVRNIYQRYLALGCVWSLQQELTASNIRTPLRTSKTGKSYGGCHFSRGALYKILANPVYIGRIVHREQDFPGQHPAIIDQELWDAVQNQLRENRQGHHQRRSTPSDSLLAGRLYDEHGHRLLPSHSQKKSKRFRYYVSETLVTSNRANAPNGIRLPAQEIETLVINSLCDWLSDTSAVLDSLGRIDHSAVQGVLSHTQHVISELENPSGNRYQIVQKLVSRVTIANREVRIALSPTSLFLANAASTTESAPAHLELTIPAQIRRCGLAVRLIIQGPNASHRQAPDQGLIQLIAKAHDWFGRLTSGKAKSVQEIADAEGVTSSYVTRVVYRSFLAPDIVQTILEGTQPATLTLDKLKQNLPLPIDWDEQRKLFGFAQIA